MRGLDGIHIQSGMNTQAHIHFKINMESKLILFTLYCSCYYEENKNKTR